MTGDGRHGQPLPRTRPSLGQRVDGDEYSEDRSSFLLLNYSRLELRGRLCSTTSDSVPKISPNYWALNEELKHLPYFHLYSSSNRALLGHAH